MSWMNDVVTNLGEIDVSTTLWNLTYRQTWWDVPVDRLLWIYWIAYVLLRYPFICLYFSWRTYLILQASHPRYHGCASLWNHYTYTTDLSQAQAANKRNHPATLVRDILVFVGRLTGRHHSLRLKQWWHPSAYLVQHQLRTCLFVRFAITTGYKSLPNTCVSLEPLRLFTTFVFVSTPNRYAIDEFICERVTLLL